MFELIFAIGAIAGIGSQAKQRGGRLWLWSTLAAVGFTLAALTIAGPLAIAFRWAPLGLVYVAMLVVTHRRRVKLRNVRAPERFDLPSCRTIDIVRPGQPERQGLRTRKIIDRVEFPTG